MSDLTFTKTQGISVVAIADAVAVRVVEGETEIGVVLPPRHARRLAMTLLEQAEKAEGWEWERAKGKPERDYDLEF